MRDTGISSFGKEKVDMFDDDADRILGTSCLYRSWARLSIYLTVDKAVTGSWRVLGID